MVICFLVGLNVLFRFKLLITEATDQSISSLKTQSFELHSSKKARKSPLDVCYLPMFPKCSIYGIFTYIWLIFWVNVGKYSIHWAYGFACYIPLNSHPCCDKHTHIPLFPLVQSPLFFAFLSCYFFKIKLFFESIYCGWLRNPAPVDIDGKHPIILLGFRPSFWWCRISLAHPPYFVASIAISASIRWCGVGKAGYEHTLSPISSHSCSIDIYDHFCS